jgi:hypothetical protein
MITMPTLKYERLWKECPGVLMPGENSVLALPLSQLVAISSAGRTTERTLGLDVG